MSRLPRINVQTPDEYYAARCILYHPKNIYRRIHRQNMYTFVQRHTKIYTDAISILMTASLYPDYDHGTKPMALQISQPSVSDETVSSNEDIQKTLNRVSCA